MNKTIIININGLAFHIEEEAYELLNRYMTGVKNHFSYSKDSEEIVSDIENRIGEMFAEILETRKKTVIDLDDVQGVTKQMGEISDFERDEESDFFEEGSTQRKLFRDPDDRRIGGVCAGIAHYFAVEPTWIRIALGLTVLFGGFGLLLYTILWIVIPSAKTRAEKMAMKGEPINLRGFKMKFEHEMQELGRKFSDTNTKAFAREAGNIFTNLAGFLRSLFKGFFKVFVKIVGFLILLGGGLFLIFLALALAAVLGFWDSTQIDYFPFNIINPEYSSEIYLGAALVFLIPVIALILFVLRSVFNRKVIDRTGAFSLLILWLTGLFLVAYYGSKIGSEFAEEASVSKAINVKPYKVLYLRLDPRKLLSAEDSADFKLKNADIGQILNEDWDDHRMPNSLSLYIEKTDLPNPGLTQVIKSRGKDFKSALENARSIRYYVKQTDSVLEFNNRVTLDKTLWRNPEVKLTLNLPVNTKMVIDSRINYFLRNYSLWDCKTKGDEQATEWIMTEEGLKCLSDSLYNNTLSMKNKQ